MKFNLNIRKDKKPGSDSTWIDLKSIEQIEEIKERSSNQTVVIFKHSTRCAISSMAKQRLINGLKLDNAVVPFYYLNLIAYRSVSNTVADEFGVQHESPQILLIRKGEVVYHASHNGVTAEAIHDNV